MTRRGPIFRTVSAVLLVTTPACVSWRPYEGIPAEEPDQDRTLRLHLTSGETVQLKDAFIVGDTMWVGTLTATNPPRQRAVLLTEVQMVEEAYYPSARATEKRVGVVLLAVSLVGLSSFLWIPR